MYMRNVNAFIEREQAMSMGKEDCENQCPRSHRWIGKEIDYKEMIKLAKLKEHDQKAVRDCDGHQKILASCEQAKRLGYKWLWADTCCIDKRSSAVCYAYLHDVTSTSFPKRSDDEMYPNSDGYPQWFSSGWTLQEMMVPSNVQFFNKDWQPIGNKRTLARTLSRITQVPEYILRGGLSSNRLCIAQIIAYSLLGLLDVNMPMLDERTGRILADDPSFFEDCNRMELMDRKEFIKEHPRGVSVHRLGVFPANRGIRIWTLVPWLPCRDYSFNPPVTITLWLWNSNYRSNPPERASWRTLQFCQIYLRHQDIHRDVTFEIDYNKYSRALILFASNRAGYCITMGVGQCFDHHWIHVAGREPTSEQSWQVFWQKDPSLPNLVEVHSQDGRDGLVCVKHFCLPGSTWTIRTSCIVWEGSLNRGVRIEVFRRPYSRPDKWIGITVKGTNDPNCDMWGLMIPCPVGYKFLLLMDGWGYYGYFMDDMAIHLEENISVITPKQHKDCHSTELTNKYLVTTVIQCLMVLSNGCTKTGSCESMSAQ
ncbi:hypothetical protein V8B97DRAFT_2025984 [Scleroderma yunnanense]